MSDFYEEDERVEDIAAAFEAGERMVTRAPDDLDRLIAESATDQRFMESYDDAEVRSRLWQRMLDWSGEQHITQTEIARRLGVGQPTVSQFESRGDPRLSTLQRYARALGGRLDITFVRGDQMLGWKEDEDA